MCEGTEKRRYIDRERKEREATPRILEEGKVVEGEDGFMKQSEVKESFVGRNRREKMIYRR